MQDAEGASCRNPHLLQCWNGHQFCLVLMIFKGNWLNSEKCFIDCKYFFENLEKKWTTEKTTPQCKCKSEIARSLGPSDFLNSWAFQQQAKLHKGNNVCYTKDSTSHQSVQPYSSLGCFWNIAHMVPAHCAYTSVVCQASCLSVQYSVKGEQSSSDKE